MDDQKPIVPLLPKNLDPRLLTWSYPESSPNFRRKNTARLIRVSPVVLPLVYGAGMDAFLREFLSLWQTLEKEKKLYISTAVPILFSAYGCAVGVYFVLHPNRDISTYLVTNTADAALRGAGFVLPFLLGEIIRIYCKDSRNCRVSSEIFLQQFMPGPLFTISAYALWRVIPKTTWINKSKLHNAIVITGDALGETFFYSRGLQSIMINIMILMRMMNVTNETVATITYEYLAIPVAIAAFLIRTFKPNHSETIEATMMSIITVSLILYEGMSLKNDFDSTPSEQSWALILKSTIFGLELLGSGVFTALNATQYLDTRIQSFGIGRTRGPVLPHQQATDARAEDLLNQDSLHKLPVMSQEPISTEITASSDPDELKNTLYCAIQHRILTLSGCSGFEAQASAALYAPYQSICQMSMAALSSDLTYQDTTQQVLQTMQAIQYRILELKRHPITIPPNFVSNPTINAMNLRDLLQHAVYGTMAQAIHQTLLAIQCRLLELLECEVHKAKNFIPNHTISSLTLSELLSDPNYKIMTEAVCQTLEMRGYKIQKLRSAFEPPTGVPLESIHVRSSAPSSSHTPTTIGFSREFQQAAYGATDTTAHNMAASSSTAAFVVNQTSEAATLKKVQPSI